MLDDMKLGFPWAQQSSSCVAYVGLSRAKALPATCQPLYDVSRLEVGRGMLHVFAATSLT